MGYSNYRNRRPFEAASKSSHHHIINDQEIQSLLGRLYIPPSMEQAVRPAEIHHFEPPESNPIQAVIAVDGGYTEAIVNPAHPSRLIHFLQFGALAFKKEDLDALERGPFIAPEDMAKLNNIHRLKLALPTKNIRLTTCNTLTESVLQIIYDFFADNDLEEGQSLLDTLAWFIFRRYKGNQRSESEKSWSLATNPNTKEGEPVVLLESEMDSSFTFPCPSTRKRIRLTDIFRLHEAIDEETGAVGILGYLVNVVEHMIIIHIARRLLSVQREMLGRVFFIKDGPTGFFGQTARLHEPMRDLVGWLHARHNLFLVGLEKSGAFVEHANEIEPQLPPSSFILLSDEYIYRNVLPGIPDPNRPYAATSNYGHKVIFKSRLGQMYVVSIPTGELHKSPSLEQLPNLLANLANVELLRCDMYDSALFPVALVNKLVSLSAHPSQRILQRFAVERVP